MNSDDTEGLLYVHDAPEPNESSRADTSSYQPSTPPTANVRITQEDLPDGRGYKVLFSPEDKKLETGAANTFVYASPDGLKLIQALTPGWVWANILNRSNWDRSGAPAGAESVFWHAKLADKECIIKHAPPEPEKPASGRTNAYIRDEDASKPDYLRTFGTGTRVMQAMVDIRDELRSFHVGHPITEYFAGKDFAVEEYRDGVNLQTVMAAVRDIAREQDLGHFGLTKRQWLHWFAQFDGEVARLSDVFFMVGYEKGEPFNSADFAQNRWICTGLDLDTDRPVLILTDQSVAPIGGAASVMDTGDKRNGRYQEIAQHYASDPLLTRLRRGLSKEPL
jgi:hypothetical protein